MSPPRWPRSCPSRTDIPGLPAAGTITDLLLPAVKAIFDLSAALTVGWLLAAAWLVPAAAVGHPGRRRLSGDQGGVAGRDGLVRSSGFALIPLILSDTLGKPIGESMSADWVISGISILDSVRAALIAAIVAALIAVLARVVLHPGWAAVLLAVALVGGDRAEQHRALRRSRATMTSRSTPWSSIWSGSASGWAGWWRSSGWPGST